jgi:Na+/H+ antiporter NhaD/arsenite permease-like protein
MIIGHMSHMPFLRFSSSLVPVAVIALALEYGILRIGFRNLLKNVTIQRSNGEPRSLDRRLMKLSVCAVGLVFCGFVAGLNLAWTALAGGVLLMVLARRDTHEVLKLVDWHLLVFFAGLFVVVEGLNGTGLPDQIHGRLRGLFGETASKQTWNFAWFSVIGSNVFSNVPFVLVAGKWIKNFAQPDLMWKAMALTTTFAGNLTILGSVANIIVVESARRHVEIGFWDYARFGIPVTILTTLAGLALLLALG